MANYSYPYQNQLNQLSNQFGQLQQMFPQPQGSVYSINSPVDIGNVPIGSTGLSLALCLNENLMYIKSFQNGNPVIVTYKIMPHNPEQKITQTAPDPSTTTVVQTLPTEITEKLKLIDELQDRIVKLEHQSTNTGGKFDELL